LEKLDAAAGETLLTYEGSGGTEELVYHDGMLLAGIGDPSLVIEKSDGCFGYWEMAEFEEPTVEKTIVAYDAATGAKRWTVAGENLRHAVPLSLCARGDSVFYLDNRRLHCLDAESGKERWAAPFETEGLFIRSYAPTVVACEDVIMCLKWDCIRGYSVATGEKLWENKGSIGFGSPGDLFVIGEVAWTAPMRKSIWRRSRRNADGIVTTGIDIPKTEFLNEAKTAVGLNIHTGKIIDELPFAHTQHHHRCYRNKATEKYILLGHSGIQVLNPETKTSQTHRWVRGICQYGIMPANGYLYVPPDTCRCYGSGKINGFFALSERNSWEDVAITPVLEKGPAYSRMPPGRNRKPPGNNQWPTYRGDISRSGSSPCTVPAEPNVTWKAEIGENLTAPVIADGRVFVADRDAYAVYCLGMTDGSREWKYLANGPVDSPPTIYQGLCIFGCGDGSVYCLDAESGELAWRFKTSKIERRIGGEDRLESPLRIHGSTLALDDAVYFAAGYSSNLDGGIRLYGIDAWTGEQRSSGCLASGHWGDDGQWGFLADILVSDGTTIGMRGVHFDKELEKTRGGGLLVASTGLLEDAWFHRMGWQGRGGKGQLIVFEKDMSFSVVNPYTGLKQRRRGQYEKFNQVGHLHQKFTRYEGEFFPVGATLNAKSRRTDAGWSQDVRFQPRAMVLAGDKLYLAGWTDALVIELKTGRPKDASNPDPHDAYLRVYSADRGELLSQIQLEAEPVFDGMAAAADRLFVSLKSGKLVCLGR
jgi:outer membrane protein assembly factor BamB